MLPSWYDFNLKYPPQVHSLNAWLPACGAILKASESLGGVVCPGELDYVGWDLVISTPVSCRVNYPLPPTPLPQITLMSLLQWPEITSHSNLFLLPVAPIRYFVLSWEKQGMHASATLGLSYSTSLIPFSPAPSFSPSCPPDLSCSPSWSTVHTLFCHQHKCCRSL